MHAYNFEYYSLKPKDKLQARRIAMYLKTDKHIVASLLSGFTKSMLYEPLFARYILLKIPFVYLIIIKINCFI